MSDTPLVNIVIPLYNEEKILRSSVERLISFLKESDFPYRYSITLVNNASTDSSATICADLAKKHPQVKALNLKKKGKGLAIRTAWAGSDAEILTFMDTDLSSDLKYFLPLIDAIAKNGSDMAIGNRLGRSSRVYSKRATRKVASHVYNVMARALLGTSFADHQCGFKAIKKESFIAIAPKLEEDGFIFDTELLALAAKNRLDVRSVDIIWRDTEKSKVSLFGDSLKMFTDLFRLRNRLK